MNTENAMKPDLICPNCGHAIGLIESNGPDFNDDLNKYVVKCGGLCYNCGKSYHWKEEWKYIDLIDFKYIP